MQESSFNFILSWKWLDAVDLENNGNLLTIKHSIFFLFFFFFIVRQSNVESYNRRAFKKLVYKQK